MMTFSALTTCKESIRRQIEVSIMNKGSNWQVDAKEKCEEKRKTADTEYEWKESVPTPYKNRSLKKKPKMQTELLCINCKLTLQGQLLQSSM